MRFGASSEGRSFVGKKLPEGCFRRARSALTKTTPKLRIFGEEWPRSTGRTRLRCPYCPAGELCCLKMGAAHPEHRTAPRIKLGSIPGKCWLAGKGPRVGIPASRGRGEAAEPLPRRFGFSLTQNGVFPLHRAGLALRLPPRCCKKTYNLFLYFSQTRRARPARVSNSHLSCQSVGSVGDGARSPRAREVPPVPAHARRTPGWGRGVAPRGVPSLPPQRPEKPAEARRGSPPAVCGSKSHYGAKRKGS